ncbi:sulfite dehydrogenase [Paucibacter soli]|uniref:sulfite dehydrogenase n=1 Tax=Paucibacter soli TaxID=3133433 RepID=UPI0030A2B6A2
MALIEKRSDHRFLPPASAGGGLLERRSFLASGLGLSVALAPGKSAAASVVAPGGPDLAYGQPSAHEAAVQRSESRLAGFSVWRTPLAQQRGIITPSGLHFAVHHNGLPEIDPQRHALMIHGLVDRPLRFDLQRLARYPMRSQIRFLECAGNTAANALSPFAKDESATELFGELSGTEWTGIPLALLLREAGIKPSAKWLVAEGADAGAHSRSLPLDAVLQHGLLALYQNGERLRPSQGYPMRLIMPGWEGNVNVKWLQRLELSDQPAYSKDESGLYTQVLADGRIERFAFAMDVKSVITHPSGGQQLADPKGFYEISGLAWSGHGRIAQVEVSADGGRSWARAELQPPVLDRALTRFSIPWQWSGKPALLMSRASDEQGRSQPTRADWKRRYAAHSFNHYNAIQAWQVARDGRVSNVYA